MILDMPFAGGYQLEGRTEEFVHPDPYAILRVLNIAGAGFYSWAGFASQEEAVLLYNSSAKAQNEMRHLLDLGAHRFYQTDPFGAFIEERYAFLVSWADRWAILSLPHPDIHLRKNESIEKWVTRFRDQMHSSSGIAYYAVLDRELGSIVWHEFLCETGWVNHPMTGRQP